jgi:hypothetical protein
MGFRDSWRFADTEKHPQTMLIHASTLHEFQWFQQLNQLRRKSMLAHHKTFPLKKF